MKLNTVIRWADGREGTICYRSLDGEGGVFGRHTFTMPDGGFGDLPAPEFMLRTSDLQPLLVSGGHRPDVVCMSDDFEFVEVAP